MFAIKEIETEQTYPIRLKVLKTNDKYQHKYQGDFNKDTKHFGIFNKDILIGIVTVMPNEHSKLPNNAIQLRGMAVLPEYQKKGIGKILIKEIEKRYSNKSVIWCNARDYAIGFYKALGFSIIGKKFYIKNVCDHFVMYKHIKKTDGI